MLHVLASHYSGSSQLAGGEEPNIAIPMYIQQKEWQEQRLLTEWKQALVFSSTLCSNKINKNYIQLNNLSK